MPRITYDQLVTMYQMALIEINMLRAEKQAIISDREKTIAGLLDWIEQAAKLLSESELETVRAINKLTGRV